MRKFIHSSAKTLYPRQKSKTLDYRPTGNPLYDEHLTKILGNLNEPHIPGAAPTKDEGDLIQSGILVRNYLEKVKLELPKLKSVLKPEPYEPPSKDAYMVFEYTDVHSPPTSSYDLKVDGEKWSNVRVVMNVKHLSDVENLNQQQTRYLCLLCNEHFELEWDKKIHSFDPLTESIHISCNRYPLRAQNRKWIMDTVTRLLEHVKSAGDLFEDVSMDLSHSQKLMEERKNKEIYKSRYPVEWINKQ